MASALWQHTQTSQKIPAKMNSFYLSAVSLTQYVLSFSTHFVVYVHQCIDEESPVTGTVESQHCLLPS